MRFLIAIPTYNRPDLLLEAVDSVISQDYQDWRMIVSDNQSQIQAETVLADRLKDPRIRVIRQPEHVVTGTEHFRRICRMLLNEEFDYVNLMADDDYMAPGALRHLATLPSLAEYVVGNVGYYYQKCGEVVATAPQWNGEKIRIDARKSLIRNSCYGGGISVFGEAMNTPSENPDSHVSFIFLHRTLLTKFHDHFGGFLIDPFGDVGLGRACKFVDSLDYIQRPIGVIRFFNNYGQIAGQDRRRLLAHHTANFVHSPLKHVSFANCAAESYLTVLSDLCIKNVEPSPRLFLRHVHEILHDKPKNLDTARALWETIWVVFRGGYLGAILSFALYRLFKQEDQPYRNIIATDCRGIGEAARRLIDRYQSTKA